MTLRVSATSERSGTDLTIRCSILRIGNMNIKKCNSHPKIKTRRPGKRIQRTQKSRRILVKSQNLTNPK